MPNHLFDALFAPQAGRDDPFLHLPDGGALSCRDFDALSARLANALIAADLRPGDRLAAQIAKTPAALALYAACIRAGIVFLPLNTAYTDAELAYFIENSGARMVVCDPSRRDGIRAVTQETGPRIETVDADGRGSLLDAAAGCPDRQDPVARGADDLAAFLYTSGTTGRSKGAMLTHANLVSNARTLAEHWRFSRDDVLLHALPIFHTHGLFVATNVTLAAGGSMIFLPGFDLDAIVRHLPRATTMMGVPTFYTRMLDDDRVTRDLVANMRLFVSGSAPLLAETHAAFEARTGHRILERYGMTETNMITSNPYEGERRAGTVGFPLPGVEIRIADPETGASVPEGEIGQIEVRGPNVFAGYWQMPEKTAAELRTDGFFVTGDLASRDADGYVSIVGRGKDLVISGGYNVYPKEIELVLDAQPGVRESAVIGVPHPDLGETPVGVLVPRCDTGPDLDRIQAALRETLAGYKRPRALVVIDELPRNTMGKVQKNALRERYRDLFADAPARPD
ncbi:malonyl-CoA synthase [uncultured Jannaschia sp.]|uniref:malonate--CoA ligase n=1 Tax=uncultured Jannaschia sp. TaxID=293347 RepID=UPI00263A0F43|nr:malonyl-CoA synthase [uncultured Jannaschia sp.]